MSLSVNTAQINSASRGNNDLRETLTAIHLALQSINAQTGTAPPAKVDKTATNFTSPPTVSQLSVSGANGSFSVSVTNSTKTPTYQEISSSPVANFVSGVVTYPVSTNTSYVFPNPGATLYWRLRSSYNQQNWSSYTFQSGAVSSGLQTSAAIEPNVSLNQSNFATIDSVADGSSATVRIYGSGGVGTAWTSVSGSNSKVIPAGTILNVTYGSTKYVAWDGSMYRLVGNLTQTFPDGWVPVGKVSVIANGAGLSLPTFTAVISQQAVVAIKINTAGNGMTSAPVLTIAGGGGSGATATCTEAAGSATGVTVTNAGSGYTGTPTVTASGGVSAGVGGGGGATGQNTGRLYGGTT